MPVGGFLLGSWYCTAIGYHQMVECMGCCIPFQLATCVWVALLSLYGDFQTQLCPRFEVAWPSTLTPGAVCRVWRHFWLSRSKGKVLLASQGQGWCLKSCNAQDRPHSKVLTIQPQTSIVPRSRNSLKLLLQSQPSTNSRHPPTPTPALSPAPYLPKRKKSVIFLQVRFPLDLIKNHQVQHTLD